MSSSPQNGPREPGSLVVLITYSWLQPFRDQQEEALELYRQGVENLGTGGEFLPPWISREPYAQAEDGAEQGGAQEFPSADSCPDPYFWAAYLGLARGERPTLDVLNFNRALSCLLPLRLGPAIRLENPSFDRAKPEVEAWQNEFLLPLGLATVLTLRLTWTAGQQEAESEEGRSAGARELSKNALSKAVDFACRIAPDTKGSDQPDSFWNRTHYAIRLKKPALSSAILKKAAIEEESLRPLGGKPTIITTIVTAEKAADAAWLKPALLGFCTRNPDWTGRSPDGIDNHFEPEKEHLPPSRDAETKLSPEDTPRFGYDDGNVVIWIPRKFGPIEMHSPGLALVNYHTHQIFAALQTLGGVMALEQLGRLRRGAPGGRLAAIKNAFLGLWLPAESEIDFQAKNRPWLLRVARLMGRLYGGGERAYRSWSSHYYLGKYKRKRLVDAMRRRFGEPELYSQLDEKHGMA